MITQATTSDNSSHHFFRLPSSPIGPEWEKISIGRRKWKSLYIWSSWYFSSSKELEANKGHAFLGGERENPQTKSNAKPTQYIPLSKHGTSQRKKTTLPPSPCLHNAPKSKPSRSSAACDTISLFDRGSRNIKSLRFCRKVFIEGKRFSISEYPT